MGRFHRHAQYELAGELGLGQHLGRAPSFSEGVQGVTSVGATHVVALGFSFTRATTWVAPTRRFIRRQPNPNSHLSK